MEFCPRLLATILPYSNRFLYNVFIAMLLEIPKVHYISK